MTRKHFEALAAALKAARETAKTGERVIQHAHDVNAVADVLAFSNPRFDRQRFLRAAGALP